jgi:hypothetical protein
MQRRIRGRDCWVYDDFAAFSKSAIDNREAAFLLNGKYGYVTVMTELQETMKEEACDESFVAAVSAGALICDVCSYDFSASDQIAEISRDSTGATSCPSCSSDRVLYVYANPGTDDITIEDVKILKAYSRHYAQLYWERHPEWTEIPHVCGEIIQRGYGFSHFGSDITCETCFKEAWGSDEATLEKIKDNRDYFGAGLLDKARAWSETHRDDFHRFCGELGYTGETRMQ